MKAKSVLYAAVGAPVVAARKVSGQVTSLREQVSKETSNYSEAANKAIDDWAVEGEKVISRIREGKVVEEISQKVDLDQAKEQVTKLRDQLEDMLATWRHSFRPDKANGETGGASGPAAGTGEAGKAEKPAAKTGTAKTAAKPAAKQASATKTTKSSTAAKTSSAKTEAAKAKAS